jgi:hypothetical protein
VRCEHCHAEKLVAFGCKKCGLCTSCGARRMAETAALLADEVLPERPLRQWVLSLPHARLVAIVARFGGWGRVAPTALLPPARESLSKGSRPSRFPHHLAQEQLAHRKQHPHPRG